MIRSQGLYRYVNGDRYHGLWHNNVPHGAGTYTTKNGFEYRGQWENGKVRVAMFHIADAVVGTC